MNILGGGYSENDYRSYLAHHGILGMKWGVRRYQNSDGSLTAAGKKHYSASSSRRAMEMARDRVKLSLSDKKATNDERMKLFRDYQKKLDNLNSGEFTDADENEHKKLMTKFEKVRFKTEKRELGKLNSQISKDLSEAAYYTAYKKDAEEWLANGHKLFADRIQKRLDKTKAKLDSASKNLEKTVSRKVDLISQSDASNKLDKIDKRFMALRGFDLSAETIRKNYEEAVRSATNKEIKNQKNRRRSLQLLNDEMARQQREIFQRQIEETMRNQTQMVIQQHIDQAVMQQQMAVMQQQMMHF